MFKAACIHRLMVPAGKLGPVFCSLSGSESGLNQVLQGHLEVGLGTGPLPCSLGHSVALSSLQVVRRRSSHPHWLLARSFPQCLATSASPAWQLAPSQRASKEAIERVYSRNMNFLPES